MKVIKNIYRGLISEENIFGAWREFRRGKGKKQDVLCFERDLEDNLFLLLDDLEKMNYQHGDYQRFYIRDPKFRVISKSSVRDRVVHHLVYEKLCQIYAPCFIRSSYSSQSGKGTHLAVVDLERALRCVSNNFHFPVFALKGDVKNFFASVNHGVLLNTLSQKIHDNDFMWLVHEIISSFSEGLPLGNVTSQVFANIYLNGLDQFIKHKLRVKYYFRYSDDFIILDERQFLLERAAREIDNFLKNNLALRLNESKTKIRKFRQGIDFCGYIVLPYYRRLRTKTARRMLKKSNKMLKNYFCGRTNSRTVVQSLSSYFGMLKHCCGRYLLNKLLKGPLI